MHLAHQKRCLFGRLLGKPCTRNPSIKCSVSPPLRLAACAVEAATQSMQSSWMTQPSYPAIVSPFLASRVQAACILDEAKGAASLGLIFAVALAAAGLGHSRWQWASLAGVPAWLAGRAAHLL